MITRDQDDQVFGLRPMGHQLRIRPLIMRRSSNKLKLSGSRQAAVVRSAMGFLGITQRDLAERAGWSQPTVLNVVAGRPVRFQTMGDVLSALGQLLQDLRVAGGRAAQLAEQRASVSRLRRELGLITEQQRPLVLPGGGMPPNAQNRLDREARPDLQDLVPLRTLLDQHPFLAAIDGGIMTGKTTLVLRVEEDARQRGFDVVRFDCLATRSPDLEKEAVHTFSELTLTIAECLGLPPPSALPQTAPEVLRWFFFARRRSAERKALLSIDQVTDLHTETATALLGMLRVIGNEKGGLNLSGLVALAPLTDTMANWMEESQRYFSPVVEVPWFCPEEVNELARVECGGSGPRSQPPYKSEGHPGLSHAEIALGPESLPALLKKIAYRLRVCVDGLVRAPDTVASIDSGASSVDAIARALGCPGRTSSAIVSEVRTIVQSLR